MSAEAENKIYLPLHPRSTTYKDDPHASLSETDQKLYDEVLKHFTRTDPVYILPNVEKGELMEAEQFWLSRECLLRYLRASKWKVATAIQRLEATLKWRREFGLYDLVTADHVEPEAVTGKEILFGYDKLGKPAFYMIPSRQNTTEATRQIQFAVWMLERGVDLMEPGVENLALLINFGDRGKNPSISTALAVLSILQNHYPERLGLALIINVPFLVNAFFKVVMPLVDPVTRQKVKFNPEIFKDGLFTTDMTMKEWGGEQNFEYNHDKYWADLVGMCENRTKTWMANWRQLGAEVGISEWAYKTLERNAEAKAEVDVKPVAEATGDTLVVVLTDTPGPPEATSDKSKNSAPTSKANGSEDTALALAESSAPSVATVTTVGALPGAGGIDTSYADGGAD